MKNITKAVICGIVAIALQTNAYAAGQLQVAETTLAAAQKSAIAKKFLQERLGLAAGKLTEKQLLAALSKVSPAEAAAVVKALNAYSSQVMTGTSAAAKTNNENAAKAIFQTAGKTKELSDLVTKYNTRTAVDAVAGVGSAAGAAAAESCKIGGDLVTRLANNPILADGTRNAPTAAEVENAIRTIQMNDGKCAAAGDSKDLTDDNLAVLVKVTLRAMELQGIDKNNFSSSGLYVSYFVKAYKEIQGGTDTDAMAAYKAFTEHCKIMKTLIAG